MKRIINCRVVCEFEEHIGLSVADEVLKKYFEGLGFKVLSCGVGYENIQLDLELPKVLSNEQS